MVLRSSWPSANGLTTHAHTRRDLEGAVIRNLAGKIRPGVFPAHHNPLFTRRNDMRLDIPDFRAVQDKGGPAWIAGEGATTTPAFGAAPAANKRIDLLYLTQELPGIDPTTEVGFFVEQGVASPAPSIPALPAARADAIPWLSVEIPAGATSMQSAGVIIKELYPYTAMAGGTVVVRDLIELAAWTPADGARAYCIADTMEYVRKLGAWEKQKSEQVVAFTVPASFAAGANVSGVIFYSDVQQIPFPNPRPGIVPAVAVSMVSDAGAISWASIPNGGITDTFVRVRAVRAGGAPSTTGAVFHVTLKYP